MRRTTRGRSSASLEPSTPTGSPQAPGASAWATRMLRIDEFVNSIDQETRKGREGLGPPAATQNSKIPAESLRMQVPNLTAHDLPEADAELYLQFRVREDKMSDFNKNWFEMIQDEVRYKRPFLGNGQNLSDAQHPHNEQLYVTCSHVS